MLTVWEVTKKNQYDVIVVNVYNRHIVNCLDIFRAKNVKPYFFSIKQ